MKLDRIKRLLDFYLPLKEKDFERIEENLDSTPIIFVENNALAFFDVKKPRKGPLNVQKIKEINMKTLYKQPYRFSAFSEDYFTTSSYIGPLWTVSVTTPCIVFSAHTIDNRGEVKSSGVYHAEDLPPGVPFQKKFFKLVDTVKSNPNEDVIIKAAGSNFKKRNLEDLKYGLEQVLKMKDLEIKPEHQVLGDISYRVTEFHPLSGQMITYHDNSGEKTIL
jgi:hypothetical protein